MVDKNILLPILGYGERLIEPIRPTVGSGDKSYPRTYQEARDMIKDQLRELRAAVINIPEYKRMKDIVFTVRLNCNFLAKSYIPNTFFRQVEIENIGSRRWIYTEQNEEKVCYSKMHFVKGRVESLSRLDTLLDYREDMLTDSFKKDVQKLEKISLLLPEEVIQGFDENWSEGKVEIVLHPFDDASEELIQKCKYLLLTNGAKESSIRVRHYVNGPTFISAYLTRETLSNINDFNPLRTIHPIRLGIFPEMRSFGSPPNAPNPPAGNSRSRIKIGMFDGGVDVTNSFLQNHVKENIYTSIISPQEYIQHGTAVAGVILYGPLNGYDVGSRLPQPAVSVESFRVLPISDPADIDLYEAIDKIEDIVPARNDIDVYNLSFGPCGPILDDDISRFTYVLDDLAWNYRKLFVVAVGNDGDLASPNNRIQSPSDIVNGLGVGAFTYNTSGDPVRARYSCIGYGREGCKVKPDVTAFGGDENRPFHVISLTPGKKMLTMGTSFSSPIIAGKAGEMLGRCDLFSPLVARTLLIHSATNPNGPDVELGYGIIEKSAEEIMSCTQNAVSVVYASSIRPTNYAKLPIPFPLNIEYSGTVEISWTIAVLSKANPLHVEDYTQSAVEDIFYPHDQKYRFSKEGRAVIKHIVHDADEISQLISEGWTRSVLPVSRSMENFQTEQARRAELKWDTVVKRWDSMRVSSLRNPFLVLHGMGRNGNTDRLDYAVIVTISAPRYQGNLYEDILAENRLLEPIAIRPINEILVPIV